jgi:hypothetical protein
MSVIDRTKDDSDVAEHVIGGVRADRTSGGQTTPRATRPAGQKNIAADEHRGD